MGRLTSEEKASRMATYDDIVWDIFIDKGWDGVTYKNIADEIGIAQSSLQSYYKTSQDFGEALNGRVLPYFMARNKLDGTLTQFEESWEYALINDKGFKHIIFLLLGHIADPRGIDKLALYTLHNLMGLVETKFGSEGSYSLERLFGYSLLKNALNNN